MIDKEISRVGILYNKNLAESQPLAEEIDQWLNDQGIDTLQLSAWEDNAVQTVVPGLSMMLVLGGDGSTLHAARLTVPYGVPIMGINLGRIGFLSEAQPDEWKEKLSKVLTGDYWVENRLLIHASLKRNNEVIDTFSALNEVVVGRGEQARVIRLHLRIDGDLVTTYIADALIVATPTGSTAYSMAAGGPLLPPQLQNIVVVPVAAHLSLDRALVLHEEAEISITVEMDHSAQLTADGQRSVGLKDGDEVVIIKNEHCAEFIRVSTPGYFYRRLMRRLGFSWAYHESSQ